jgi:hypothetical protein
MEKPSFLQLKKNFRLNKNNYEGMFEQIRHHVEGTHKRSILAVDVERVN